MASTIDPSAARLPLGDVSDNKRSAEENDDNVKPAARNDELSPYQQRMQELQQCCERHEQDKTIYYFFDSDELLWKTGKLRELGIDDEDTMEEHEKEAALDSLTQAQIEKHFTVMLVDQELCDLKRDLIHQLLYADPRNDEEEGMVMLNTYSSWCMYPIINRALSSAIRVINKAKKAVEGAALLGATSESTNNVAAQAFNKGFATILACDGMDHWKEDTESPEDCEKIAKRISKISADLLWFEDAELGLIDPYSRKTMLDKLEEIHQGWRNIGGVKYKTAANGQGLGRSQGAPEPPKKKRRTVIPVAASTMTAGSNNDVLVSFLNNLQDKKKLRQNTSLQIKLQSVREPEKSALVVVSGTTNMKKMSQLCGYLVGRAYHYDYYSLRGACIKGSRIEVELQDAKLWLAANGLSKQAAQEGVAHVEDKKVKIIQVFQGLTMSQSSGLIYDSDDARQIRAYWVTPEGERFEISVQAIISNKVIRYDRRPLPILVNHSDTNNDNCLEAHVPNLCTGFGMNVYQANDVLRGNRDGPTYRVSSMTTQEQRNMILEHKMCEPIADQDGTLPEGRVYYDKYGWNPGDVATAGLPPPEAQPGS